jgi:S-DNA-T family DNA segregation ATPase FtsK/SpoIIIE
MSRALSAANDLPVFQTPVQHGGKAGVMVYLLWVGQVIAWLFLLAATLSFSPSDWPGVTSFPQNDPAMNWCGPLGAVPAFWLFSTFGWATMVGMALWGLYLFVSAFFGRVSHVAVRFVGVLIMCGALAGLQGLLFPSTGPIPGLSGGLIGKNLASPLGGVLYNSFSGLGTFLVLTMMFLIGATVALDVWVVLAPMWAYRQIKEKSPPVTAAAAVGARHTAGAGKRVFGFLASAFGRGDQPEDDEDDSPIRTSKAKKSRADKKTKGDAKQAIDENAGGIGGTDAFDPLEHEVLVNEDGEVVGTVDNAKKGKKSRKGKGAEGLDADDAPFEAGTSALAAGKGEPQADAADDAEAEGTGEATSAAPAQKKWTPDELRAKISKLPLRFAATERRSATADDLRDIQNSGDMEGYKFPSLDLLEEPEANYPAQMEQYIREQATALERALKEYKIDGEVVGMDSGPVITLYEVRLAAGTKVAALSAIASDLARSLKAVNVRIVSNTAGKDTVGVEVPNPFKEKVRLKELMTKSELFVGMKLPMFLGKDAGGAPLIADLAAMPHMLIAGTTGSGKSVCMNAILMSFLYTKKPNELKLVLVDPKMVEFAQFKDIPHLMCPVVTEMSKAAAILEWAVRKMDERYELLMEAGCRDITGYNALTWEELKERFAPKDEVEEARIPKKLPYMVFVIDELADLMMTNKEVEHSIVRIAQKARAVGIHLIVATQRPQANVVTGLIKSNMPARLCFKVASGMDSRIVMDQKGGELLLGHGDSLYKSPRTTELSRAQGSLVDDKEIRRVTKFLKEIAGPTFERSLLQIKTGASAAGMVGVGTDDSGEPNAHDGYAVAQQDELFEKAVDIVMETKIGSVSMLQRRLAIGYTRSARLIELMAMAGILGQHKGTVAREVLVSPDEWEAMKAQAAEDAANGGASGTPAKEGNLFVNMSQNSAPPSGDDGPSDFDEPEVVTRPTSKRAKAGADDDGDDDL